MSGRSRYERMFEILRTDLRIPLIVIRLGRISTAFELSAGRGARTTFSAFSIDVLSCTLSLAAGGAGAAGSFLCLRANGTDFPLAGAEGAYDDKPERSRGGGGPFRRGLLAGGVLPGERGERGDEAADDLRRLRAV